MSFLRRHINVLAYLGLALVVAYLFYNAGVERDHIKREALIACKENEKQNQLFREEARERFRNLDETLELIGVKKTPRIVRRAKLDRDRTLSRFAPHSCPRNGH